MLRASCLTSSLNRTSPFLSLFLKIPLHLARRNNHRPILHYHASFAAKGARAGPFLMDQTTHMCTAAPSAQQSSVPSYRNIRLKKKALRESPEGILKGKLDMCSKNKDLIEALQLYDDAKSKGVQLNQHHYNVLLYLCGLSAEASEDEDGGGDNAKSLSLGLKRGFHIFQQMIADKVNPNEATFTNVARIAVALDDQDMAFDMVKKMTEFGIRPKLRSYGPALFGFCKKGNADKAYEVDAHMVKWDVAAEEPELSALLKLSVDKRKVDKVYEILHRLRVTIRQVPESTAETIEEWFKSDDAAKFGAEDLDVNKVREAVVKVGGGWHGQGWLGTGRWKVVRTHMDDKGVCNSCGEKLVCIDIDPVETENFAASLTKLACQREIKANFSQFQEWLERHGPFDAVIDGANMGLVNQRHFNFHQLNCIVKRFQHLSLSKKLPLIILHTSRVTGHPADLPKNKSLLERWKKAGALYSTPTGSNDDWYWLYAAVSNKCLLVTNDEMRDHLFQLLGNSFFPRWKEKHQVRLSVSKENGMKLHMPPPYSIVIQESEHGSWHVPMTEDDDLTISRQWLCATRPKE